MSYQPRLVLQREFRRQNQEPIQQSVELQNLIGHGPNRRSLAVAGSGEAVAVHGWMEGAIPAPHVYLRQDGQWQRFTEAEALRLTETHVHFHQATGQFLLLGRKTGKLSLYAWKSGDVAPVLLHRFDETEQRSAGARVKVNGKLFRQSLDTDVFSTAELRLADFMKEKNALRIVSEQVLVSEALDLYRREVENETGNKPQSKAYREWCRSCRLPGVPIPSGEQDRSSRR